MGLAHGCDWRVIRLPLLFLEAEWEKQEGEQICRRRSAVLMTSWTRRRRRLLRRLLNTFRSSSSMRILLVNMASSFSSSVRGD
jgi:hypothetical protein